CILIERLMERMRMSDRRRQNEPMEYGESKKKYTVTLTPTAWTVLDEMANQAGLSRSDLIERIARGLIPFDRRTLLEGELPAVS
ncbi:ribbon-helix-helix protein, CopG family, partial [Rhizobium johnstonii]